MAQCSQATIKTGEGAIACIASIPASRLRGNKLRGNDVVGANDREGGNNLAGANDGVGVG
ncbi:MAG TPA: hypothetical protein VMX16_03605 [Terriglobia bacterium]|nr:hypothetical protein [Terriglobia bacterium]